MQPVGGIGGGSDGGDGGDGGGGGGGGNGGGGAGAHAMRFQMAHAPEVPLNLSVWHARRRS